MKRTKIGIVDDEVGVRESLIALLSENEFEPVPMESSADFEVLRSSVQLDLILIDLQLKGESGLELAMEIRRTSDLPIIMVTGRGDETDKIVGLEVGADDYMLKPFNPRELIARIRAVLRRYDKDGSNPSILNKNKNMTALAAVQIDHKNKIVTTHDGDEISLTNAE